MRALTLFVVVAHDVSYQLYALSTTLATARSKLFDMNVVILRNIASDAASILEARLADRRRSKPFEALAERMDNDLERDLRAALQRESRSLRRKHSAVAEEIDQLLARLDRLPR
jgi:hypothetical protein